eukprot:516309-Pyramimonas_sp.AAC.1
MTRLEELPTSTVWKLTEVELSATSGPLARPWQVMVIVFPAGVEMAKLSQLSVPVATGTYEICAVTMTPRDTKRGVAQSVHLSEVQHDRGASA